MTAIVVYDLEYTSWDGAQARRWSGPGEHREIIQIGAVRCDGALSPAGRLDLLVRPRINPVLSDYIVDLTGITQERLDAGGLDYAEALGRLAAFSEGALLASNGDDDSVVMENCRLTGLDFPFAGRCLDVSNLLRNSAGRDSHVTSGTLGAEFGLDLDHVAHDALGDAQQVAASLRHLLDSGRIRLADILASRSIF